MDWNFVIKKIVKQNSKYYSVFIEKWTGCRCGSTIDAVVIYSDSELTPATDRIRDIIQLELQKQKIKK